MSRMEPVGYGSPTAHGMVVSKTPLSEDAEPLYPLGAIRSMVEEVRVDCDWGEAYKSGFHAALDALRSRLGLEP